MGIVPQDEAAAIFAHYFAQLAKAAGLRWSERNQADIERACELLGDAEPVLDEIPPYQRPIVPDRQTLVLDRPQDADPTFQKWRGRRAVEDDDVAVRRLVRR